MNCRWLDKQKARALQAHYREYPFGKETPSEYFIHKRELLDTVFTMDDTEIILEVMEGAPANWNTILTTQLYDTTIEFQTAIRFYEDTLIKLDDNYRSSNRESFRNQNFAADSINNNKQAMNKPWYNAKANVVGSTRNMEPPKFPKDDSTVST